jgi:hypothetical protein
MQQIRLIERPDTEGEWREKPVGQVTCPNCQVTMLRISLKRLEDENQLHEAVYRCPQCNTETKRWMAPKRMTRHFRSTPNNGHHQTGPDGPVLVPKCMARAVRCKTEAPRPTNVKAATMYQTSNVEH